jgi:general secretion pathway protein M
MKEFWRRIKELWTRSLNIFFTSGSATREQRMMAIGGVVVILFAVYQFIWSPLLDHANTLRKKIITQQKLLVWMRETDKELQAVQSHSQLKKQSPNVALLLAYLQKQVQGSGIKPALKQLKQSGSDAIEMQFQKVEFDKLIAMLTTVIREQGVTISHLSVTAGVTPGIVNATVHLSQSR